MHNLTIKNVPTELYQQLRRLAADERRSLNGEVIYLLEQGVRSNRPDPKSVLERAAALRGRMPGVWVTQDDLDTLKSEGRR